MFHPRKIIYSKEAIYILDEIRVSSSIEKHLEERRCAITDSDGRQFSVVDAVPLFEVEAITSMNELDAADDDKKNVKRNSIAPAPLIEEKDRKCGDSNKVKFRNSVQIRTVPVGFNSGRKYYLQAKSSEDCQKLCEDLTRLSAEALERFLAKTRFQKAQEVVKGYYLMNVSQYLVAFLIIAVSGRSFRPIPLRSFGQSERHLASSE
jgi:hypothetical protein